MDLDLKTLVNVDGETYLVSTVSMLVKTNENDDDFQTLVLKSEKHQDDKLGRYEIDYDCIDWINPIENYFYNDINEAKNNHIFIVRKYQDKQGYCGIR